MKDKKDGKKPVREMKKVLTTSKKLQKLIADSSPAAKLMLTNAHAVFSSSLATAVKSLDKAIKDEKTRVKNEKIQAKAKAKADKAAAKASK